MVKGTLVELSKDSELQARLSKFLTLVNVNPPKEIVKEHPIAPGVKYIPIEQIENLLSKVFQQWHVEVLREGQLLNSIYCTVRLHYVDPVTNTWTFQDGLGAVAIQVDKDQDASDLKHIKSNAIMLGLPAAKSFAIKDAAEHIGKLFGRDLNRKEKIAFEAAYTTSDKRKAAIIRAKKNEPNRAKKSDNHS